MESQQARFGGAAALAGGAMWITYYGIDLISGAMGNRIIEKPPFESPITTLVLLLFNGAIIGFNAANLGLFRALGGRSRGFDGGEAGQQRAQDKGKAAVRPGHLRGYQDGRYSCGRSLRGEAVDEERGEYVAKRCG